MSTISIYIIKTKYIVVKVLKYGFKLFFSLTRVAGVSTTECPAEWPVKYLGWPQTTTCPRLTTVKGRTWANKRRTDKTRKGRFSSAIVGPRPVLSETRRVVSTTNRAAPGSVFGKRRGGGGNANGLCFATSMTRFFTEISRAAP